MVTRCWTRVTARPGLCSLLGFAVVACVASRAFALPSDGEVVSGNVSIRQVDPLSMQIDQTSDKAIVNWRGFSIAQGETLQFRQPGAEAVILNRVLGSDPSSIFGRLSANGHVFLVNPNGVLFGPAASVHVGGLVASTLAIRDEDFLAGRYTFAAEGDAKRVVNQGQLTAADGGYISLIGTQVVNDGVITARLGTVALGAGQRLTLDFAGDDLIRVAVDDAAVDALVANGNLISAEGGRVFLNASATNGVLNTVLNVDGVIEATSLSEHNGVIRLDGGSRGVVAVSGRLDASGGQGQTGGTVTVLGDRVGLFDGAAIDVSGGVGGGAVFIGGNFQGQGPEANARYTYVDAGASINADAVQEGRGGQVVVWADEITRFAGLLSARGGTTSGDGGFVEVSGKEGLVYQGLTDLRADRGNNGTLLLDPRNVNIALGGLDLIALADAFSELLTTDVTFAPLDLQLALNLGNVTLQASNDITLSNLVTTLGLLTNNDLTLEAGRSITIAADLSLRGSFTASANVSDPAVVEGDRTAGTIATFTMADGVTIDTSVNDGDITIDMSTGDPAGVGFNSGDITIANLDAGAGNVLISQGGQTPGSDIVRTANSLITANSAALDIGNAGNTTGSIGASGTAINVEVTNLEARTQGGDIFVSSPTQGVNVGSAGLGGLTGLLTNGGNASLTTAGTITDSEAVIVTGTATFLAGAGNDIVLDTPTSDFGALNIASGNNVTLVDANALDLGASTIAGNLMVTTAGALTDSGALSVAGITTLAAGAANDITLDSALDDFLGTVSIISGRNVTLVDLNALDLGASTIAGDLLALAGGPITLSGPLSVGGATDLISLISDDVDSIANQFDSAVATVQGTLPDAMLAPVLGELPPVPPLDTPPIELPPIIEPPDSTTDTSDSLNIKNRDCEELILTERQSYVCREKSAKRPASPDD